jgi:NADP-dependent 3-hydroxy acid dehydrogenase YdfG
MRCIVTGGSSGIGEAICRELAMRQARIFITGRQATCKLQGYMHEIQHPVRALMSPRVIICSAMLLGNAC